MLKDKKVSLKGFILALILVSAATAGITFYVSQMRFNNLTASFLDVEIYPREAKISPGQLRPFLAVVNNGSVPYEYKWYSNGSYVGEGQNLEFGFDQPCSYTILSVRVVDSEGNLGFDSISVYDPTAVTIMPRTFTEAESYTFWREENTYYAKNGLNASIISGTSISNLTEAVVNATAIGGDLLYKNSTYEWDDYVYVKDTVSLTIRGESGAIIQATDSLVGHDGTSQFNSMFLTWSGSDLRFTGLIFDGQNKSVYSAILISFLAPNDPTKRVTIDHCTFRSFLHPTTDFMAMVVFCQGGEGNFYHHNRFVNCGECIAHDYVRYDEVGHIITINEFIDYRTMGINFEDGGSSTRAFRKNIFSLNTFEQTHAGTTVHSAINFIMDDTVADKDNLFIENTIVGHGAYSNGIVLTHTDRNIVSLNSIRNCTSPTYGAINLRGCQYTTISENTLAYNNYSIAEEDYDGRDSEYNSIIGNILESNTITLTIVGSYTVAKGNIGARTENYGDVSIGDGLTSAWVAHGLIATPTVVLLTAKLGYDRYIWWNGANSTHIRVWADGVTNNTHQVWWYAAVYQGYNG